MHTTWPLLQAIAWALQTLSPATVRPRTSARGRVAGRLVEHACLRQTVAAPLEPVLFWRMCLRQTVVAHLESVLFLRICPQKATPPRAKKRAKPRRDEGARRDKVPRWDGEKVRLTPEFSSDS